jgi:hypothetical protein
MNFVERLLTDHRDRLGLSAVGLGGDFETALLTPRFATSRHVVALVYPKGERRPRAVVKIPRQPGDDDVVQLEAQTLQQLAALPGADRLCVPTVLGTLTRDGHTVMVQSAVVGTPLSAPEVRRDFRTAMAAGTAFISTLPVVRRAEDNADWYRAAVERPLSLLAEDVPLAGETAELCARTHALLEPLRSVRLPAVFEHGDLAHPNLFLTGRGPSLGVIDWERAIPDGVPGHDLIFFLQFLAESAEPAGSGQAATVAFDKAFVGPGAWGVPILRGHLRDRGLEPTIAGPLVVASWARTAATLRSRLIPAGIGGDLSSLGPERATGPRRDLLLWRHAIERAERGTLAE